MFHRGAVYGPAGLIGDLDGYRTTIARSSRVNSAFPFERPDVKQGLCVRRNSYNKRCGQEPAELLDELSLPICSNTAVMLSGPPAFFAAST